MLKILALASGGAMGTLARYGVGRLSTRIYGGAFPLGTAAVNLGGCFLFGLAFALFAAKGWSPTMKLLVITGFMGAFTTFSTYMFETQILVSQHKMGVMFLAVGIQNIAGFGLVWLGLFWGNRLCGT